MFDGFWIVTFAGMEGKGGGVVVFMKGKIFGGDSAFTYLGTYQEVEGGLKADVLVQNFDPLVGNVLGIKGDFTLKFELRTHGKDELQGQASTLAAPGFGLKARLVRRANLD
ncbi:MAG: GrlR family regulatory protein [Candidatus Korobacteraceae bacterium]|jgi:hypothetical protein